MMWMKEICLRFKINQYRILNKKMNQNKNRDLSILKKSKMKTSWIYCY